MQTKATIPTLTINHNKLKKPLKIKSTKFAENSIPALTVILRSNFCEMRTFKYSNNWNFPSLGYGKEKGMNNASDIFKHLDNVGLETAQNSRNSCRKENGKDIEVSVEYRLKNIECKFFPGIEDYKKRLESAIKYFQHKESSSRSNKSIGKEITQLSRALRILNQDTIPVLTIRDYGTKGLQGGELEELSPYYRLIKSTGISAEQGTKAGRFGHGQNALVAKSDIKAFTLFSQFTNESKEKEILFAGNSILCSHIDPNKFYKTQETGFIGTVIDENQFISYRNDDLLNIDFPYNRSTDGTDIYIWGFKHDSDKWDLLLAKGLIKGFFAAIREKLINFKIINDNTNEILHEINHQNLDEYYSSLEVQVKKRLSIKAWNKEMQSIYGFLKTTCNQNSNSITAKRDSYLIDVKNIGNVEMILYQDKDDQKLTKEWCIMRQPLMKIRNFNKPIGIPFNAVVKVLSDKGNDVFMDLEDPTHLKLVRDYCDEENVNEYWSIYQDLSKKVQIIIENLDPLSSQTQDIPGLADLIPDIRAGIGDGSFFSPKEGIPNKNNKDGFNPSIITDSNKSTITTIQKNASTISTRRTASSEGNTGGTTGTVKTDKKVNPQSGNPGSGAGDKQGNAKFDPEGKKESLTINEDIKIRLLRNSSTENRYLLRIIALKNIHGDINLGMVVNNEKKSCVPLPVESRISLNRKEIRWQENKIKDINMQTNEFYDCEILLPSSAEFAISTI